MLATLTPVTPALSGGMGQMKWAKIHPTYCGRLVEGYPKHLTQCHVLTLVPFLCLYFSLVRAWVGVGILCFVFYVFYFYVFGLVWFPIRQLAIVVSDWEPYLGSLFFPLELWVVVFCVSTRQGCFGCAFVYVVFQCSAYWINLTWTLTMLHLLPTPVTIYFYHVIEQECETHSTEGGGFWV